MLQQVLSKTLGTHPLLETGRGKTRGRHCDLGRSVVKQDMSACVDDGHIKAAQKLAYLVLKGSAACLSDVGSLCAQEECHLGIGLLLLLFSVWLGMLLESSSDLQCVMTS